MNFIATIVERMLAAVTSLALRVANASERCWRSLPRGIRRLSGSLHRVWRRWLESISGAYEPERVKYRRRAWNRTPPHIEDQVVRLHAEHPHLRPGELAGLAARMIGFHAGIKTFKAILFRRRALIESVKAQRRKHPRRIRVARSRELWGVDLTIVWVLGVFPVWILGAIDYPHGSRLVALERLRRPTTAAIVEAMTRVFEREGVPDRILTDRDPVFRAGGLRAAPHDPRREAHAHEAAPSLDERPH